MTLQAMSSMTMLLAMPSATSRINPRKLRDIHDIDIDCTCVDIRSRKTSNWPSISDSISLHLKNLS